MILSGRNRVQTLPLLHLKNWEPGVKKHCMWVIHLMIIKLHKMFPCPVSFYPREHSDDELSKLNRNLIIKRNLSEVLLV